MAAKPFFCTFDYTPKWKGNRERPDDEKCIVNLRDFPESKKIALAESIEELSESLRAASAANDPSTEDTAKLSAAILEFRTQNVARSFELVKKQFVSVTNLVVVAEDGETVIEIKTANDLCAHCEELALELAGRLAESAE